MVAWPIAPGQEYAVRWHGFVIHVTARNAAGAICSVLRAALDQGE